MLYNGQSLTCNDLCSPLPSHSLVDIVRHSEQGQTSLVQILNHVETMPARVKHDEPGFFFFDGRKRAVAPLLKLSYLVCLSYFGMALVADVCRNSSTASVSLNSTGRALQRSIGHDGKHCSSSKF